MPFIYKGKHPTNFNVDAHSPFNLDPRLMPYLGSPSAPYEFMFLNVLQQQMDVPLPNIPALPSGAPNPSSRMLTSKTDYLTDPSLDRSLTFAGYFSVTNGWSPATKRRSEMGVNHQFIIEETGGTPTEIIAMLPADYDNPHAAARAVESAIQNQTTDGIGTLTPGYSVRYLDETILGKDALFCFRISHATAQFKVLKETTNNGIETWGWKPMTAYQYDTQGFEAATLHTEEYVIFDLGDDGLPFFLGQHNNTTWESALQYTYLILEDCNFDGSPSFLGGNSTAGFPNSKPSFGHSRLRVQFDHDLERLSRAYLDHDPVEGRAWSEGENMFTLCDRQPAPLLVDGGATGDHAGVVFGTDRNMRPRRNDAVAPTNLLEHADLDAYKYNEHVFPARRIVCNLRDWYDLYFDGLGGDQGPVEAKFKANSPRYMRIGLVNRGNLQRRLKLSFAFLGPSFFFQSNPRQPGYAFGQLRRSEFREADVGSPNVRFKQPLPMAAMEIPHVVESDKWLWEAFFDSPTYSAPAWPHGHALQTWLAGAGARPMYIHDPFYEPWQYEDDRFKNPSGKNWVDSELGTGDARMGTGLNTTKYARGCMFGYGFSDLQPAQQSRRHDDWNMQFSLIGSREGF